MSVNYSVRYGIAQSDPRRAVYGADTCGIESERDGCIVAYVRLDDARMVASSLNRGDFK